MRLISLVSFQVFYVYHFKICLFITKQSRDIYVIILFDTKYHPMVVSHVSCAQREAIKLNRNSKQTAQRQQPSTNCRNESKAVKKREKKNILQI